jgi:hypothetical protein
LQPLAQVAAPPRPAAAWLRPCQASPKPRQSLAQASPTPRQSHARASPEHHQSLAEASFQRFFNVVRFGFKVFSVLLDSF